MKKYGVLVVDDSAVMRKAITAVIEQHEQLYVIGIARNGVDAIEKTYRLNPHIVTMDIEMPVMNGLEALLQIMQTNPTAVVMLTNEIALIDTAIERGAVDYILKKEILGITNEHNVESFHNCLLNAAQISVPDVIPIIEEEVLEVISKPSNYEIVMIGSSTGGPNALYQILKHVLPDFPVPILIVQHMPVGFTKSLAQRFNQTCSIPVKEVEHHEVLHNGHVYIAPAGIHTTIIKNELGQLIAQHDSSTDIETLYKPSIDVALLSIAPLCKANTLAVILTGMGNDGLRGCKAVYAMGGCVIGEHPDSCVIYGMPKVVYEANICNEQVMIDQMFNVVNETLKKGL